MAKIFWSLGGGGINQLRVATITDLTNPVAPSSQSVLAANGVFSTIAGFSMDEINKKIYWVNFQGRTTPPSNTLYRADIDPLNPTTLTNTALLQTGGNLNNPTDVFIDPSNNKIYWTNANDSTLWVGTITPTSNTAPTNQTLLASSGNFNNVRGFFIDTNNSKIYWITSLNTLWVADFNPIQPAFPINHKLLLSGGNLNATPEGVFVDSINKKIYWSNCMTAQVFMADIDPQNPTSVTNQKLFYTPGGGRMTGLWITGVNTTPPATITLSALSDVTVYAQQNMTLSWTVSGTGIANQHTATIGLNKMVVISDYPNTRGQITVQAPDIASDYLLTIYVQDKTNQAVSDMKTARVKVWQVGLSDIRLNYINHTNLFVQGSQFSTRQGPRFVEVSYLGISQKQIFTTNGPFQFGFGASINNQPITICIYHSDFPSYCSVIQSTTIVPASQNLFGFEMHGSILKFDLALPPPLVLSLTAYSDIKMIFSDICRYVGNQAPIQVMAGLSIQEQSDVLPNTATILNGKQVIFITCSDQDLRMAEINNQFLLILQKFTSDQVTVIYSDGLSYVQKPMTLTNNGFYYLPFYYGSTSDAAYLSDLIQDALRIEQYFSDHGMTLLSSDKYKISYTGNISAQDLTIDLNTCKMMWRVLPITF